MVPGVNISIPVRMIFWETVGNRFPCGTMDRARTPGSWIFAKPLSLEEVASVC